MAPSQANPPLNDLANAVRFLSIDAVEKANSGHPGMPMGMADVATVLFRDFLKFNPENPEWPDRDRFVLSAGHGSMLLYSLLYLTGYQDITIDDIKAFRQLNSKTAGHPEYEYLAAIETTTGPLGQGFANAVGMAFAEKLLSARFNDELVDHHTYCIVGDGCLAEGISQEALNYATHYNLSKLIVLFDDNNITIDGDVSLFTSEDQVKRFEAAGWHVQAADGHDYEAIQKALEAAKKADKPSFIAFKTTIGFGSPAKAGKSSSHGAPLGKDEVQAVREKLNWSHAPFEIPEDILNDWRGAWERNKPAFETWIKNFTTAEPDLQKRFIASIEGNDDQQWRQAIRKVKEEFSINGAAMATRKASGEVLEKITPTLPNLLGGSADLSGSNNTKANVMQPITKTDLTGNYVHYGPREHAMAAMMNGIALHKGFTPYGGTFLIFSDYCKPAMRLSALMRQQVIYVMTHDSIGLGEDGPTHQPVEQLIGLRTIPNLLVFRPADPVETAECWELALMAKRSPSVIVLSRQSLPLLRSEHVDDNISTLGAYVLIEPEKKRDVTLIATGSEVQLAVEAHKVLAEEGIHAAVVSVPCWKLFNEQDESYRQQVLGDKYKVVIEAGFPIGWRNYIGGYGAMIGISDFGASAPAEQLFEKYGLTVENIVETVKQGIR